MASGYLYKFISANERQAVFEQTIYRDPDCWNLWGLLGKDKDPRTYGESEVGCAELYKQALRNVGKEGAYPSAHPISLNHIRRGFYEVRKAKLEMGIELDVSEPSKYGL